MVFRDTMKNTITIFTKFTIAFNVRLFWTG